MSRTSLLYAIVLRLPYLNPEDDKAADAELGAVHFDAFES